MIKDPRFPHQDTEKPSCPEKLKFENNLWFCPCKTCLFNLQKKSRKWEMDDCVICWAIQHIYIHFEKLLRNVNFKELEDRLVHLNNGL